jgi:hypothetical protein
MERERDQDFLEEIIVTILISEPCKCETIKKNRIKTRKTCNLFLK